MEIYELTNSSEAPTGLSRIGGVPPIAADAWPRDENGQPFVHMVTVEGAWLGRPELACVCAFGVLDGDVESDYAGNERPFPVLLLTADQLHEGEAPPDAQLLPAATLTRLGPEQLTITQQGDEFVCRIHVEGFDDITTEPAPSKAEAQLRALEQLNPHSRPDSYLGGASYNPSIIYDDMDEFRASERAQRGEFLWQMSGRLFPGSHVDFCGGGWMFVYTGGAWVEQ